MGTFAVGSAAYTLMPSRNCEPSPNAASPSLQQSNAECSSRSSSSSSHGGSGGSSSRSSYYIEQFVLEPFILGHFRFRLAQRAARRLRLVRARRRLLRRLNFMQRIPCPERDDWRATAESIGLHFSHHRRRALLGRTGLLRVHAERDRTADRGAHRRDRGDVPRTGRPRDQRRKISAPVENTRSLLAAAVRELAPPRCQPLRPAGPELRRLEPGETAGVQRGYADLDFRSGGFSVDLARTGDGAQHHPEARRPVQFNP